MPHAGLCDNCTHRKEIRSDRGSVFILCRRGLADPAWPKYPRLPVLQCAGYEARPLKIIFLGVDGVKVATPAAIDALNYLVTETGARLVLTGNWERSQMLHDLGIQGEVLGFAASTEEGIRKWIQGDSVEAFVILDSAPEIGALTSRLVRTDAEVGLTMREARLAQEMLGRPLS